MKKAVLIVLLIITCIVAWRTTKYGIVEPLYEKPYIVMYGRHTCPRCQKYIRSMDRYRLDFVFKDVSDPGAEEELHPRMEKAGYDTRSYKIPVIDVNGHIFVCPDVQTIVETYKKG